MSTEDMGGGITGDGFSGLLDNSQRMYVEKCKEIRQLREQAAIDKDFITQYQAQVERLSCEVSNLKLANKEARKTIDRLNELIPREANDGGPVSEELPANVDK